MPQKSLGKREKQRFFAFFMEKIAKKVYNKLSLQNAAAGFTENAYPAGGAKGSQKSF